MSHNERTLYGQVSRPRPSAQPEGTRRAVRVSGRGEPDVRSLTGSKLHAVADEGSYFVVTNPTPGTGIAGHAAPSTSEATKPLLYLRNTLELGADEGKRVYLDYIQLQVTAAGSNGTNVRAILRADSGNDRFSSGGSALTPVNPNMASTETSGVTARFGAVTAAAASSDVRLVHHQLVRPVINVVGDTYLFTFGASSRRANGLIPSGTTIANVEVNCPPVVLGPKQMFLLHMLATSQSAAASYEVSAGFWVR
jgi:hypothetical protein